MPEAAPVIQAVRFARSFMRASVAHVGRVLPARTGGARSPQGDYT